MLPAFIGFCPSDKAWAYDMKRLVNGDEPYPVADGRCTPLENKITHEWICLVTIHERLDDRDMVAITALIAHEAVHVFQKICEIMGEDHPSHEFEAYTIQYLTIQLTRAYLDTRRPNEGMK